MEMAILAHPKYRGKGFAKEGTIAFIQKMNKLKPEITKFRMEIAESNKASQAVAKKLEFTLKEKKKIAKCSIGRVNKRKFTKNIYKEK